MNQPFDLVRLRDFTEDSQVKRIMLEYAKITSEVRVLQSQLDGFNLMLRDLDALVTSTIPGAYWNSYSKLIYRDTILGYALIEKQHI